MFLRIPIAICLWVLALFPAYSQGHLPGVSSGSLADTALINKNLNEAKALIRSQPQQAEALIGEALALSEQLNHYPSQLKVRILQGTTHLYKGEYDPALEYFRQGLQLAELLDDSVSLGRLYNNMAVIYRKQGHYPNALELYMKALSSFEKTEDNFRTGHVLTNIANVYSDNERYEDAISYHKRALATMEKLDRKMEAGAILNNLGNCYYETNRSEEALSAYNKAFAIRQNIGDQRGTAITLHNIGNIQCDDSSYVNCLQTYRRALQLAAQTEDAYGISTYSVSLGNAHLAIGHMDSARIYMSRALDMAERIGAKATELEARQMMARLDSAQGNYKEAFVHYQKYTALKDSLFNLKNSQQITMLQSEYEVQAKQKENLALKSEVNLWKKLSLFLYLGIMVIFALFLAYRTWMKSRKKQILSPTLINTEEAGRQERVSKEKEALENRQKEKERELLQKKKELSTLHLQMMQQNETLGAIRSRLKKEETDGMVAVASPTIKEVTKELDRVLNGEDNWQSFKLHFESIHTGFFKRLQERFPALTLNDHKLCAYLRLNLTTKEIAKLLHVSPSAIQKSRQRLRKKMELQSECDLSAILSNM